MDVSKALHIVRLTDVGKCRGHNEDAVASDIEIGLLVLADGMGGYQAGEVASEIAVLTVVADLKEAMLEFTPGRLDLLSGMQAESQLLLHAVANANASIFSLSKTHVQCAGMGTTLVLAMFTNNKLLVGHVGDSRMYRYRARQLRQMTQDHSVVQEQLNLGLISRDQAKWSADKNLVTRALGVAPSVELELHEHDVMQDDIYLLCSDGLTDEVDDESIGAVLGDLDLSDNVNHDHSLQLLAQQLVDMANLQGGKDNISVILARICHPYPAPQPRYNGWYHKMIPWLR